jgi:hypothetical protein
LTSGLPKNPKPETCTVMHHQEKRETGMCPLIRYHQNLSDFLGEKKFCI